MTSIAADGSVSRRTALTASALAGCLLCCSCLAGEGPAPDLKPLWESRRWFELRDAVASARHAPLFYRVVVSCAFGNAAAAEAQFRDLKNSGPTSPGVFDAHGVLASAYMRMADYGQALSHLQAMQAADPDFAELGSAIAVLTALAERPAPVVARRAYSDLRLTPDMFIPVSVNGRAAYYGFDTGMDLSVMSESEANRLGLAIHDVPGSQFLDGASGLSVGTRFVVADRLLVGGFEVANVPFLIVRKDAMPFSSLPAEKQGHPRIPGASGVRHRALGP